MFRVTAPSWHSGNFSCTSESTDCMKSTCRECQPYKSYQLFEEEQYKIVFKEWKKVDERIQRITVILEDIDDIIDVFNHHLRSLKRHIYVKRIQTQSLIHLEQT